MLLLVQLTVVFLSCNIRYDVLGCMLFLWLFQVELELGLNTKSLNYSKSKGEQIALNVEGRSKQSGEEPYYARY